MEKTTTLSTPAPSNSTSSTTAAEVTTTTSPSVVTTSYPVWHNAIAGGVAGMGSRMLTAPLDLVRIRRQLAPRTLYPSENVWQSWQTIVRTEGGIPALFRGNTAALYLWVGYAAVQFSVYNHIRDGLIRILQPYQVWLSPQQQSTITAFSSGAMAGICATLATYPCDLCRTTFAARGIRDTSSESSTTTVTTTMASRRAPPQQVPFHSLVEPSFRSTAHAHGIMAPPKTLMEFIVHLYEQQGMRGFYAGAGPAVVQIIPYMGLNFALYDAFTAGDRSVGGSAYAGSMAGAISKMIIYPLDTIKRRLQAQAFFHTAVITDDLMAQRPYAGWRDCVVRIVTEEGVYSLYRGVVPSVLKTTIATGLSFSLYRFTKNALEVVHDTALATAAASAGDPPR